jgi:hypothetical protein
MKTLRILILFLFALNVRAETDVTVRTGNLSTNTLGTNSIAIIAWDRSDGLGRIVRMSDAAFITNMTARGLVGTNLLESVSNIVASLAIANDTTTSNALRSAFIANDTTTSNGLVSLYGPQVAGLTNLLVGKVDEQDGFATNLYALTGTLSGQFYVDNATAFYNAGGSGNTLTFELDGSTASSAVRVSDLTAGLATKIANVPTYTNNVSVGNATSIELTNGQNTTVSARQVSGRTVFSVNSTASGTGDVVGPSASVDNEIPRYDSTTGKLLQQSGASISDATNLTAHTLTAVNANISATVTAATVRATSAQFTGGGNAHIDLLGSNLNQRLAFTLTPDGTGTNELRFNLASPAAGNVFTFHSVTGFGPTNQSVITNIAPPWQTTNAVLTGLAANAATTVTNVGGATLSVSSGVLSLDTNNAVWLARYTNYAQASLTVNAATHVTAAITNAVAGDISITFATPVIGTSFSISGISDGSARTITPLCASVTLKPMSTNWMSSGTNWLTVASKDFLLCGRFSRGVNGVTNLHYWAQVAP